VSLSEAAAAPELALIHSITSSARASSIGGTEAERPGGLGGDDQLELGRLHHRQVRRLGVLEDATGVAGTQVKT